MLLLISFGRIATSSLRRLEFQWVGSYRRALRLGRDAVQPRLSPLLHLFRTGRIFYRMGQEA